MYLKKLKLQNFRNYIQQEIELSNNINIIYGDNAQGKTNLLESIYLCAFGKSFRTSKDKELINFDKNNLRIEAFFEKKDREGRIKLEFSDKKQVSVNGVNIKKLSEILGVLNVVIFTPEDINLLKNGPSNRRKFLDILIGQLRPKYIYNLNMYLKTIEQRNSYLRQIVKNNKSEDMLDIWDEELIKYATEVFKYRNEYVEKIKNKINEIHKNLTCQKEDLRLKYNSNCENEEEYRKLLKSRRKVDILKGFTSKGVHRDDFMIYINEKEVDIYGSQGQNRTVVLSLKLSELNIIYDEIGEYPILLLDDFMSELDNNRIISFLSNIKNTQVIITGTEKLDVPNINCSFYNIEKGALL